MPGRNQQMARAAFAAVSARGVLPAEYESFAKSFPALIHAAGLCQAVTFAQSRESDAHRDVLEDVVRVSGNPLIASQVRTMPVAEYLRCSRDMLKAATWVKTYAESLGGAE